MYAEHPVIESNEFGVLPTRIDEVDKVSKLLEAEEKKQVRVPMTPKMPETRAECDAVMPSAFFGASAYCAKQENYGGDDSLGTDQLPGMCKVSREDGDKCARNSHRRQTDMFENAERGPAASKLAAQSGGPTRLLQ